MRNRYELGAGYFMEVSAPRRVDRRLNGLSALDCRVSPAVIRDAGARRRAWEPRADVAPWAFAGLCPESIPAPLVRPLCRG